MRVAPVLEQLERVRQRPRGELDLVAVRLEQLDQRPQDEHVRRVGQVDPDAHPQIVLGRLATRPQRRAPGRQSRTQSALIKRLCAVTNSPQGLLCSRRGARLPSQLQPCRRRRCPGRDDGHGDGDRRAGGLGGRVDPDRRARRRPRRDSRRESSPSTGAIGDISRRCGVFSTPRPVPNRRIPTSRARSSSRSRCPSSSRVGFPIEGWVLAAVLWVAAELLGIWLARLPIGADNLKMSGLVALDDGVARHRRHGRPPDRDRCEQAGRRLRRRRLRGSRTRSRSPSR